MAKFQISYAHTDEADIVHASDHVVDGEWIVFRDGMGQVSRKRGSHIVSIERIDS